MRILSVFFLAWAAFISQTTLTARAMDVVDHGAASAAWLNGFRAETGARELTVSDRLTQAAAKHARDMARANFFSHTGSDGSSISDRARRQGYGFCFIAENIAKGQRDLQQVLKSWSNSPGHRRNMLAPEASEFAVVQGPDRLWVMVLGTPGC